ncbi:methyltransferase domain-containing protein [Polyangium aurulentum]|nr:methyltransferase domain-containing protein [Polyangium aurulentum]
MSAAPAAEPAPRPRRSAPPPVAIAPPPPPRRRSRRTVKTDVDLTDVGVASEVDPQRDADGVRAAPTPPVPVAPEQVETAPAPQVDVIQPMRIISIGQDLPPARVASDPPPPMIADAPSKPTSSEPVTKPAALTRDDTESGWTPRPPEISSITAAFAAETAAQTALPSPPLVVPLVNAAPAEARASRPTPAPEVEVETVEEELDEAVASSDEVALEPEPIAADGKAEEIEAIEEIEPDRDSDVGDPRSSKRQAPSAAATSAPKKPPPPPPLKRPPSVPAMEAVSIPAAPPPPKAAPPPQQAQAPVSQKPPSLPEPSRRRQRPWWEDLFDDDFIRTMDRTDPNVVRREVDFLETCLGLEKGAAILDLACGAGNHAVELASRGYGVVGYDLSLSMLALAADEAQGRAQKLNFLQGDMREMAFDQVFDGLYCWATSFGYFDDEKNFNVLQRMHRALRPGGMMVFDVINRDYVAPRQPSLVWFEGDGCICMDEMAVDFFTSRLKVKRTAMFDDGRSREIDYSIRLYALHEIGKMMHDADFKVVEVTGHPAHPGVFFGSESPRLIIVAERK